jgi:hypothetical protein
MKEIPAPTLMDYGTVIGDLPKKQKDASEAAVKASQTELEGFDKPGFETREGRLGKREAAQEKDAATTRAMGLINLGFGIAGSKERSLAGALGNEGRQGIQALIQGEAANRAAKDRLEDARDNFEQQKVAAKKGNYQAAQAAGKDASRDLQAATQLTMTSAHYGNTEALNRYQTQQQGDFQRTSLNNQGVLGLANLGLKKDQLAQQGSIANAQLAAREKQFAAMGDANKARIMQARSKGLNDFMVGEGAQLRAQLAKDYGPNFLTATDARSIEAARIFNQRKQAYLADITGQAIDALGARQADALLLDQ